VGWLQELLGGRRGLGSLEAQEAAEATARSNILASAERDRARARRLEGQAGEPTARWRRHDGVWERWSELEAGFTPAEPPEALVDHAARSKDAVDDIELVLVDGTWGPASRPGDGPSSPTAPGANGIVATPPSQSPLSPPPSSPRPAEEEPTVAELEAQLDAWRRRRR
jgi:hypothetical protein